MGRSMHNFRISAIGAGLLFVFMVDATGQPCAMSDYQKHREDETFSYKRNGRFLPPLLAKEGSGEVLLARPDVAPVQTPLYPPFARGEKIVPCRKETIGSTHAVHMTGTHALHVADLLLVDFATAGVSIETGGKRAGIGGVGKLVSNLRWARWLAPLIVRPLHYCRGSDWAPSVGNVIHANRVAAGRPLSDSGESEIAVSRAFTVRNQSGSPDVFVSRAVTVRNGPPEFFVSRAFTVSNRRDVFVSRAFTVQTCQVGACCLDGGSACEEVSAGACGQMGGMFQGLCTECPDQLSAQVNEAGSVFTHVIGLVEECGGEMAAVLPESAAGAPFVDPWVSIPGGAMCEAFGVPGSPAIPAGFFDAGSDPFTGTICFRGEPLGMTPFGEFGDADTLVQRPADPFDLCALPSAVESTVAATVVGLGLVSVSPITVTRDGGQSPVLWNVAVDLSEVAAPAGSVTAVKTHCNGGTYTSVLHVQARFTFVEVADPGVVRVLDTGLAGIPPVTLEQNESMQWVGRIANGLNVVGDPDSAFHPAIMELNPTLDCDCNENATHDLCDIESKTSRDCDVNNRPDECDIAGGAVNDCDGDGEPDACAIQDCGGDPSCGDCNLNGVPDGCDIANGVSPDLNGNGRPDLCEGACCLPDGTCSDVESQASCAMRHGAFRGLFCDCAGVVCDRLTLGDADADGDVDLFDYQAFSGCVMGGEGGLPPGCGVLDFDGDGDVDLLDWAGFQDVFGGR